MLPVDTLHPWHAHVPPEHTSQFEQVLLFQKRVHDQTDHLAAPAAILWLKILLLLRRSRLLIVITILRIHKEALH